MGAEICKLTMDTKKTCCNEIELCVRNIDIMRTSIILVNIVGRLCILRLTVDFYILMLMPNNIREESNVQSYMYLS